MTNPKGRVMARLKKLFISFYKSTMDTEKIGEIFSFKVNIEKILAWNA